MGAAAGFGSGSESGSGFRSGSGTRAQAPSNQTPNFTSSNVATGSAQDVGNLDAAIRQNVTGMMGNYRGMVDMANQAGVSQADIARAGGVTPGNVYSYMNRPNYQAFGPNGQFYQPIYQAGYQGYAQPSSFYQPSYNPFGYGGGMGGMGGYGMGGMGGFNPRGMNLSYMYDEGGKIVDEDEGITALRLA